MRLPTHLLRLTVLPLAALTVSASPAAAQTSFTWNNTAAAWQGAASWSPAGVPTALDAVLFGRPGAAAGVGVTDPTVAGSAAAFSVTTGLSPGFGGWTFTGTGPLTLGGNLSSGLTILGPQTTTFSGPALAGAGAGSGSLNLTATSGATLVLAGATAAVINPGGSVNATGGTLRLDDTAFFVGSRLAASAVVSLSGGGALELLGNAAGGTSAVGPLNFGNNTIGGVNTVRVTPQGAAAPTALLFANADAGGFSTRPGTRAAYVYEATAGQLGAAAGAQIRFAGAPFLGANGLLSSLNGGGSVGFAVARDAGGTDFATYTALGVVRAGATPGATSTDAAGLATLTAASRGQFNPAAGTAVSAAGTVTTGSLRVTPAGPGATLALGTSPLATSALMLDGAADFALTGTGTLGTAATRYVYVNSSAATLSTSLVVASGGNVTLFAGPGFVNLTGLGTQNTLSGVTHLALAGGTLRATDAQLGFTPTGKGVVAFAGGVLEIKGGMNGTGASADFTRPVGAAAGNVTWGAGSVLESAGGGFSASGAAASVNLGGAATPLALRWNAPEFVPTGYALKFGSAKSDAVLTWSNPIQLDNGPGPAAREFNVTKGTGGDRAVLAGVVSGTANADLLKTGGGTLVLAAANTYAGGTLVYAGTLTLGVANALPTGSAVFLGNGTLSSGVAAGFSADLGALTLAAGTPTVALGTGAHTLSFTTLAVNVPGLSVTGFTGTPGVSGTGGKLVFTGLGGAASANASFASFLAGTSFAGFPLGASFVPGGTGLELVPAPVPEPAAALGLAALGLAAARFARRRRAKTPRD